MWLVQGSTRLAIAFIPKAGTNTFRQWLEDYEVLTSDDPRLLDYDTRLAFIRNPFDRLGSTYSYFKNNKGNMVDEAPVDSWEEFVDYILLNDDVHWRPQARHMGGMQTKVYRFEEANEVCPNYINRALPWYNKSDRVPVHPYRTEDLKDFYKEDIDLWR